MLEALRRRAVTAAFALSLAAALSACGGGGGDPIPAGTCRRAAIPSTGPGDTLNYFPAEVGRAWTYRNETTDAFATTAVSGTEIVGAETAFVFTTTTSNEPPSTELVVKRPAGVYVLSDPSAEPPFDQLYPSMILPSPVAVMAPAEQATCRALDLGDLDGDLKADHADLVVTLRVFSVTETAQVQAGRFIDVAHAQQVARVTATGTSAGTVVVEVAQDDWYARDVGRVLSLLALTAPGMNESTTTSLQSWTLPAGARALAPAAAGPTRARLEEAALRLARQAIDAAR